MECARPSILPESKPEMPPDCSVSREVGGSALAHAPGPAGRHIVAAGRTLEASEGPLLRPAPGLSGKQRDRVALRLPATVLRALRNLWVNCGLQRGDWRRKR